MMPTLEKNTKNQELDAQKRKLEMIRLRYEDRRTLQFIADEFHISRQRVAQIIGNTGLISKRYAEFVLEQSLDLTNEEVARKLGYSEQTVSKARSKYRHAIKLSNSPSSKGVRVETWVSEHLSSLGIENELMPFNYEYDILANGVARIDVKSAFIPRNYSRSAVNPLWAFNVRKGKRDDCDFYACVIVPTLDVFIIPSSCVRDNQHFISFAWPHKANNIVGWEKFYQSYDLIRNFSGQDQPNGVIMNHEEPRPIKSKIMPILRENTKSLTVRLPVFLFEQVKKEADISRRSVNQQIIFMLERYYPPSPSALSEIEGVIRGDLYGDTD